MKRIAIPFVFLGLAIVILAPVLTGSQRLAFRDVSHFYEPLYGYLQERTATNTFPLWNPHDQFGLPLAGETTTAIFYPGRIIFHLGLETEKALAVFVLVHIWLAGMATYCVARNVGSGRIAGLMAGLTYSLAGPILFLYTNPPFLVGAAWLPIAFWYSLSAARARSRRNIGIAAGALAMMVLGGDAQSAFHVMLLVCAAIVVTCFRAKRLSPSTSAPSEVVSARKSLITVGIIASLACGAASVQIVPSVLWSQESSRQLSPPPGVSRMLGSAPSSDVLTPWWQKPKTRSHASQIYEYSVGPWQWCGALFPGICGDLFPQNTRITRLLPAEGRTWCPSLFAGVFPILCFYVRAKSWRKIGMWECVAVAGLLLSLGSFGATWLAQEFVYLVSGKVILERVSGAIGGPYWWLVTLCPGYGVFRYPAKWLVFFSFGVALSASSFIDQWRTRHLIVLARTLLGVSVVAALAVTVSLFTAPVLALANLQNASDALFGPLSIDEVTKRLTLSSTHVFIVSAVMLTMLHMHLRRSKFAISSDQIRAVFCVLLACELLLCGKHLIGTAPSVPETLTNTNALRLHKNTRAIQLDATNGWPKDWPTTSSAQRLQEVEWSQQRSLFVRWHLKHNIAVVNSPVSISHQRHHILWREMMAQLRQLRGEAYKESLSQMAKWMGVRKLLSTHPDASVRDLSVSSINVKELFGDPSDSVPQSVQVSLDWQTIDAENSVQHLRRQLEQLSRIGSATTFIESKSMPSPKTPRERGAAKVTTTSSTHESIDVSIVSDSPCLVKYHQFQDGFWNASFENIETDGQTHIVSPARVDYVAQGFVLPAGRWRVRFWYAPLWFKPTVMFCLISWIVVSVLATGFPKRFHKKRTQRE